MTKESTTEYALDVIKVQIERWQAEGKAARIIANPESIIVIPEVSLEDESHGPV